MTLQEMKQRKLEYGYSNEKISELSGIPLGTVIKIFSGATKAPRSSTIRALEAVLAPVSPLTHIADSLSQSRQYPLTDAVREEAFSYRREHDSTPPEMHTIEEYLALPEEKRVELIDGVFYDMASPSANHQILLGELFVQLKECERKHDRKCRVLLSPFDVQPDCSRYTVVQPDLMVICDREKLQKNGCSGPPDLVIEIMSPSSRSRDCVLKLNKYKESGVREYWIIDPEYRKILVYLFARENNFSIYTFEDKIPVGISGGDCVIDFAAIRPLLL